MTTKTPNPASEAPSGPLRAPQTAKQWPGGLAANGEPLQNAENEAARAKRRTPEAIAARYARAEAASAVLTAARKWREATRSVNVYRTSAEEAIADAVDAYSRLAEAPDADA